MLTLLLCQFAKSPFLAIFTKSPSFQLFRIDSFSPDFLEDLMQHLRRHVYIYVNRLRWKTVWTKCSSILFPVVFAISSVLGFAVLTYNMDGTDAINAVSGGNAVW